MAPRRSQALGLLAVLGFVALALAKDASSKTEEEEPTPTLEWAKKMYELDSNNFAQTMQSYEHTAVIFYNSWENSSKRLGKIVSSLFALRFPLALLHYHLHCLCAAVLGCREDLGRSPSTLSLCAREYEEPKERAGL